MSNGLVSVRGSRHVMNGFGDSTPAKAMVAVSVK